MKVKDPTVFLSSTYIDLKDYREKAITVITSCDLHCKRMEEFGANGSHPRKVMLDSLSQCQIYVGIVAVRYGSVDEASGKSYTQLEYEKAKDLGFPCLIYINDSTKPMFSEDVTEVGPGAEKLKEFKEKLRKENTVEAFCSIDDLGRKLHRDLSRAIEQLENDRKHPSRTGKENQNPESKSESYHLITPLPSDPGKVICRDDELKGILGKLEDLEKEGENKPLVLVSGFGGIGKTSLAKKLFLDVHENKNSEYDLYGWIPYNGDLKNSFYKIVDWTEVNSEQGKGIDSWWKKLSKEMSKNREKKLFIIDNFDEPTNEDLKLLDEIVVWPNTSLLLTSRESEIDGLEEYPIGFLPEEACVELFYLYYKNDPDRKQLEDVKKLIELAYYHTLTIEILAKSAKRAKSLSEFHNDLLKKGFKASKLEVTTKRDADKATVEKHLKKLFDITKRTVEESAILWEFAVMPFWQELSEIELEVWFGHDINDLEKLIESGWLYFKDGVYSMHPLIKRIINLDKPPENTAKYFLDYLEKVDNDKFFDAKEGFDKVSRKLGIVESVYKAVGKDENTPQLANIARDIANIHRSQGQYKEAEDYCKKALEIYGKVPEKEHSDIARINNNLGGIYWDQGKYKEAKKCWTEQLPDISIDLEMIEVKPGEFMMGSPEDELGRRSNETQHSVTLTQGFRLGKYPVTQEQYEAVMGYNPFYSSYFKGGKSGNHPVENVSWDDAMSFCAKLTEIEKAAGRLPEGYKYILPTEAQWEYACRVGTTTALNNGKNLTSENGNCPNLDEVGWYNGNSGKNNGRRTTHPVGKKKPNAWGFYDMHGNVWEWCLDWYGDYPTGGVTDPRGPNMGLYRVMRGGGWLYDTRFCRSASRYSHYPDFSGIIFGFRIALSPVQ